MIIICDSQYEYEQIAGRTMMYCNFVFVKYDDKHYIAKKNRYDGDLSRLFTIEEVFNIIKTGTPDEIGNN